MADGLNQSHLNCDAIDLWPESFISLRLVPMMVHYEFQRGFLNWHTPRFFCLCIRDHTCQNWRRFYSFFLIYIWGWGPWRIFLNDMRHATQVVCLYMWVPTLFQSVTNGKETFSRLLFCRLKSDCRRTLGTESVRILESTAQDPCISDGFILSLSP